MSTALFAFHVLVVVTASSRASAGSVLGLINVRELDLLALGTLGDYNLRASREDRLKLGNVLGGSKSGIREDDLKLNVHVTIVVVAVLGHALAFNDLDGTRRDNLTGNDLDNKNFAIEVLDSKLSTSQGSEQVKLDLGVQVIASANKALVGLLINDKDDITGDDAGALVTLSVESNLLVVDHTLVDVDFKNLALLNSLLTVAALASVLGVDDLTLSLTVLTDSLESLDHGSHLSSDESHTLTLTGGTGLDGTFLATLAFTRRANDGSGESKLRDLALVKLSKGDLESMHNVLRTLGSSGLSTAAAKHATAKELGEDIVTAHATGAATTVETVHTIVVVDLTLLAIGKDLVCARDFLELLGGFGVVLVLIRVVLEGVNSVSLLDFRVSGTRLEAFVS